MNRSPTTSRRSGPRKGHRAGCLAMPAMALLLLAPATAPSDAAARQGADETLRPAQASVAIPELRVGDRVRVEWTSRRRVSGELESLEGGTFRILLDGGGSMVVRPEQVRRIERSLGTGRGGTRAVLTGAVLGAAIGTGLGAAVRLEPNCTTTTSQYLTHTRCRGSGIERGELAPLGAFMGGAAGVWFAVRPRERWEESALPGAARVGRVVERIRPELLAAPDGGLGLGFSLRVTAP